MKKIINSGILVMLAMIAFTSCKKDVHSLSLDVTPVATLTAPTDNTSIVLQPATGSSVVFQWSPATAADGGLVLYEIAFDKAGGNFSNPVYKVVSDGSGVQPQVSISQKDMNKIASLAGIAASTTGSVKWTVIASKAANTKMSSSSHTLSITRPAGFAVIPINLYITGSATEGGADITKAIPLQKTADGVFELYTSLKAGTYQLTDKPDATGTTYYVDANGIIQLGSGSTTITGATKEFRLDYDLNVATTSFTEIQTIGLWVSAYATEQTQLKYVGNSTWESDVIPIVFYQFSWGRDDRYKYVVHTPAGDEWMGSKNADNVPPAGQAADYFYLHPVTNDQWNNTYKFDPAADNHHIKVDVYFQASGPYTQKITYLN